MNTKFANWMSLVKHMLHGFDRIVFKGYILPIMHVAGVQNFLYRQGVLNKGFKTWMMAQTQAILDNAETFARRHTGRGIEKISSSKTRKEELVHTHQQERGIAAGLIGVYSALESCTTFKAGFDTGATRPKIRSAPTKCKHLYFYSDHPVYGFMNVRLQTWFPYHVQLCMNGREWLRRSLEQEGIGFLRQGNKFFQMDDFERAQVLLDAQLDTRWRRMLDDFVQIVFPDMPRILGPHLDYYWTLWQSEWASDYVFESPEVLCDLSPSLLKHAFMTGTHERVLHYMDRPLTKAGRPYANCSGEVLSRFLKFQDGYRLRHWLGGNSAKIYTQQNILRLEGTINLPNAFKVYRQKQGAPPDAPKQLLPLRKGVADIALRAKISQQINNRVLANIVTLHDRQPLSKLIDEVCRRKTRNGRRVRGLEPTGKDRAILQALADPAFELSGITNKNLRNKLRDLPEHKHRKDKQLSAYVSRQFRLLRDHGLIRKLPNQNRYHLTDKGRKLTTSTNAILNASINELMEKAA